MCFRTLIPLQCNLTYEELSLPRGLAGMTDKNLGFPGGNLTNEQLASLYDLARFLLSDGERQEKLDQVVDRALAALSANHALLAIRREAGLEFAVARGWNRQEPSSRDRALSSSILHAALEAGRPILVEDALADPRFSEAPSVFANKVRSVLAAPIVGGALYLERRTADRKTGPFGLADLELFEQIVQMAEKLLRLEVERLEAARRAPRDRKKPGVEPSSLAEQGQLKLDGYQTQDPDTRAQLVLAGRAAKSDLPVLVTGGTGVGKELVARAIHEHSARPKGPFVAINCSRSSSGLLESELFGHQKGAFTGADQTRTEADWLGTRRHALPRRDR